ncbi:pilus assembly protein [Escherichia coli]|nr:pilus assembly protein [Escherichia coli]
MKKKKITYLSVMSMTGIVFLLLFYIALKSFLVT